MAKLNEGVDQDAVTFLSELEKSLIHGTAVIVGTVKKCPPLSASLISRVRRSTAFQA